MDIIKKLQRKLALMTLAGFLIVLNVLSVKAQEEDNAEYTELVSAPVEELSELITENEENQDISSDLVVDNQKTKVIRGYLKANLRILFRKKR